MRQQRRKGTRGPEDGRPWIRYSRRRGWGSVLSVRSADLRGATAQKFEVTHRQAEAARRSS